MQDSKQTAFHLNLHVHVYGSFWSMPQSITYTFTISTVKLRVDKFFLVQFRGVGTRGWGEGATALLKTEMGGLCSLKICAICSRNAIETWKLISSRSTKTCIIFDSEVSQHMGVAWSLEHSMIKLFWQVIASTWSVVCIFTFKMCVSRFAHIFTVDWLIDGFGKRANNV